MNYLNLAEELASTTYPGRGIVLGRSQDGKKMVIAYFIMGRSENSRNRVFVEQEGGIRTEAFDPAKLADPSLIIYAPVRVLGAKTIVTNGDQTDTIYDFIKDGKTFEEALRTRTFEPDAPNFTPRISGVVEGCNYKLSILKSNNGDPESNQRYFFEYEIQRQVRGISSTPTAATATQSLPMRVSRHRSSSKATSTHLPHRFGITSTRTTRFLCLPALSIWRAAKPRPASSIKTSNPRYFRKDEINYGKRACAEIWMQPKSETIPHFYERRQ